MNTRIDETALAQAHTVPRPPLDTKRRILVGLADEDVRARVTRLITDLGYEAVSVADGYRLTESLADSILGDDTSERPDAIIINPVLCGCTGLSLLSGLRDLGWNTPVIFIIDGDDHDGRRQAWARGVTGVFITPFSDRELRAFLDLVLDPDISDTLRAARSAIDLSDDNLTFAEGTNPGLEL